MAAALAEKGCLPAYTQFWRHGTVRAKGVTKPSILLMAPLNRTPSLPRHFLFMLPASATQAELDAITESARRLVALGYVYIASPKEKTMEDRDEIRYLPLNVDVLPCFGAVTAVCVVRDEALAQAAREAYPGTQVMVVDPRADQRADGADKPAASWLARQAGLQAGISQAA